MDSKLKKSHFTAPEIPINEVERLEALKSLHVLDTPYDFGLDEITTLASRICDTPISLISLIDENRQWFKSKIGIDENETPRDISFCGHVIHECKTMVIEDAQADLRFQSNPLVTDGVKIRFYAGAPLITSKGYPIGTLCVIDHQPRHLTAEQISSLEILSKQVIQNFERNKIERELIIQKNFFGSIVNVLPQLVSYIDKDYNYLFRNSAYRKWFNKAQQEENKISMKEILSTETFLKMKPYLDQALAGNAQDFEMQAQLVVNGQSYDKILHANYIPDFDNDKKVRGFFAVVTDLTEQKAKENIVTEQGLLLKAALLSSRANEKTFKAYFENSAIGMIKLNSKMQFLDANPAYLQMMEYTLPELQKMSVMDITYKDDLIQTEKKIVLSATEKVPVIRFEKRSVTKSGRVIWLQTSGQTIQTEDSNDYQIFVMVQDISALKEAEKQVQEQQVKLIQISKMSALGEMAGGVAHEINNPLAIILGKLEKLKYLYEEDRQNETIFFQEIEKIRLTAVRIGKIVRGLQAFSRDGSKDPVESVTLDSILTNTIALCSERFSSYGVKLVNESILDVQIECHPTEISQIILNLLNNAYDAVQSETEKWIVISTNLDEAGLIKISVTDSGKGIDVANQVKIMQPFFTTKEIGKGTGLGLSIAKGLAEAHGGDLFLDATSTHTRFTLIIPQRQKTEVKS